jgi:hypothetical protein
MTSHKSKRAEKDNIKGVDSKMNSFLGEDEDKHLGNNISLR